MDNQTTADHSENHRDSLDALFASLADRDRRHILQVLYEQDQNPVPQSDVTTTIAAGTQGKAPDTVPGEPSQHAVTALHHTHLPSLTAAGLVDFDSDAETIALTGHAAFDDPGIVEVIEGDVHASADSLDALFRALADTDRRTILDRLSHQIGPIHIETLARELEADVQGTTESQVPTADVDKRLIILQHAKLPQLADAGLIDYDPDTQMVEYTGHTQLRVPWMHSVLDPAFRQSLTGESEPAGIGEIDGREQVISFGQSLCDRADEELFCMFTDTQLLEAGCLARIRDAARVRDADVYLGTRDPTVREYVEENAPEVVLWEPNTSWLNLPAAEDRVGRLLMADREAVMLGTLLEEQEGSFHDEQAMVGEGDHNTLVTMIRQLLAPHLEEIDKDTDEIETQLPL